jgi:23S rRNA (adenine2503-C2)-methyltransferase
MTSLAGLSLSELEKLLYPLPRFRAVQVYKWITQGINNFDHMTDIPKQFRKELHSRFSLFSGAIVSCHDDIAAKKIVISLKDSLKIEAVLLYDNKKRFTACLSTQAGCPAGCIFCKTGSLGFSRNLTGAEITEQLLFLRTITGVEKNKNKEEHIIDNIVIMGMGEPFLNLKELRKAISVITDKNGLNYSRRRITVSTCGICDSLFDFANNGPFVKLALSLTTADELLRQNLMPITKFNPLQKIKDALVLFQKNGGTRITLEVPLLGGINTRDKDAVSIADFAAGIDSVVNIIPWNPVEGLEFEGKYLKEPDKKEIDDFIKKLESLNLKVTRRYRKGRSVMGACGQLGASSLGASSLGANSLGA